MTTTTARLPDHLHQAYNWTDAAGELDELRDTRAWRRYSRASARNSRRHAEKPSDVITEGELLELRTWLRANRHAS